jgi:quercetin dioxygenase-like cupin family protein
MKRTSSSASSPRTRAETALVAAAVVAVLAGCTEAAASTSSADVAGSTSRATDGPEVVVLAHGVHEDDVDLRVDGPLAVDQRVITLGPGESTGQHCHHGRLLAVVHQGELTHYADVYPGGVHVYRAGDAIDEGSGDVHEGRNEGDVDTVPYATHVTPEGEPLAESDLEKCDA